MPTATPRQTAPTPRKAQLDEAERKHLEDVVVRLRKRVEKDVRYWIEDYFALKKEEAEPPATLSERERTLRSKLREAIEREQAGGRSWAKARKLYIKGVGYTLVNRLAALRCMEVRGFLERAVTRFRGDGRTPAADPLIDDYFLSREEGVWVAFLEACRAEAEEIEILFDLSDPYSLLLGDVTGWDGDPLEVDTWSSTLLSSHAELLQDLGRLLDEVGDAVWRADDVLGWVYEYYNVPDLDAVRKKARGKGLDPEDVPAANQFYTPHWVVRMLTDNSLGKLFLEHKGTLQETVERQQVRFSVEERKNRDAEAAESIEELCTYLVATEEEGEATDFDHPSEIRVFDPACGSGHFLLYAFDVLERIWWAMTDVPRKEVPAEILQYNLFGVDLDLRACQLAAFNLYLKARTRTEQHGATSFEMPTVGIVCADAHVADLDRSHVVFDEVAAGDDALRDALGRILTAFEQVEGLGSLLDVKGTLAELVDNADGQLDIFDDADNTATLPELLARLHQTVAAHTNGSSFRAKDLRSFLRLLVILSQDYDVALMNPPYGSGGKMPDTVQAYVEQNYSYKANYYVSFFEMCDRTTADNGRVGMLIPRSFLYKGRFSGFREDFVGPRGGFDFLAEFGTGVLDNATVRTVGTVVRTGYSSGTTGLFFRLYDVSTDKKENAFINALCGKSKDVQREFRVDLDEFRKIPRTPICYSTPYEIRELYEGNVFIDADQAGIEGESIGSAVSGLVTGLDERFVRKFWEIKDYDLFRPLAYGGEEAWIAPHITDVIEWGDNAKIMKRSGSSVRTPNSKFYGEEGLTWTRVKYTTRRFGYYPGGLFETSSFMLFPRNKDHVWAMMAVLNSDLYSSLFLSQTPEKEWDADVVGCLPWIASLEKNDVLGQMAKSQYSDVINIRITNPSSLYYIAPALLPGAENMGFYYEHPHADIVSNIVNIKLDSVNKNEKIEDLARKVKMNDVIHRSRIERVSRKIDNIIYDEVGIDDDVKEKILTEIFLRTSESPEDRDTPAPESILEVPGNPDREVKLLAHHFAMEIAQKDDDGIVLLRAETEDEEADLMAQMVEKFESIWGKYAHERLGEVDKVLGSRTSQTEPYPNLRHWLENRLFTFHCSEFERTPILWQLSTERLVSDPKGTGFACLVDYHQLGADLFDRLSARYLEARKAALRERLQSARRAAEDPSADASTRAQAREEAERCDDALRQIEELERVMSELSQPKPREWAEAVQDVARKTAPKVRRFRERLEERLATLDRLHEISSASWFKGHFSNKFMESVNDNRGEWIDALEDLEAACEQFAQPAAEPVEAHLYDLLPYFDKLTGSTHYSSNGIFFLNYYFSKGKGLAAKIDQGRTNGITKQQKLVADLARETDADVELGEEIKAACQEMAKPMDAEWRNRALEEVMTAGYRPVKKHGVAINITPLAEKKIVPSLVEEKVI